MESHYTGATDVIWAASTYGYTGDRWKWFYSNNNTLGIVIYKIQTLDPDSSTLKFTDGSTEYVQAFKVDNSVISG